MKHIIIILLISITTVLQAQNSFTAIIKDKATNETLIGANCVLNKTTVGASADVNGKVSIQNIPDGNQTLVFSYIGYETVKKNLEFPLKDTTTILIFLERDANLQEITVYSTRTNNRIEEIPTRVEVLGNEEVVEETAINPGNISKLLGETSGIKVQHTSAVSGNVSFRIQGLSGKYTQLLQDGFPLYSGFSSGLSLLQIPPLDLQQVEIIKGAASTLYGGDAIAGIVNLITKKPKEKSEFSVLINQTHKGGRDISSFFSGKNKKIGITMLAGINTQTSQDVNGNGFADITEYNRAVISPKIFYDFNKSNHLIIGLSSTMEDRLGGDIKVINNEADTLHTFFEKNKTKRIIGNLKFESISQKGNVFTFKTSIGNFNRRLTTNTNHFDGVQNNVFSEISYDVNSEKHKWVSGLNFYNDDFRQNHTTKNSLSYTYQTFGMFSQDNWQLTKKMYIEPGIRFDYNIQKGNFLLPRLAMMYHLTNKFFTRLSGGLGYKLPSPFTDEAERTRFQDVRMPTNLQVEKSDGVNLDFNYKTPLFDELFLTINQAFFVAQINSPIIANADSLQNQIVANQNEKKGIFNKGMNSNIRISLDELTLYIDYTYLDTRKKYDQNNPLTLTPQNSLTSTLAYEDEEEGWKIGLEAFYFGNQWLENGGKSTDYWLLGASAQKTIGHFTLALNIENILDVRQTRYENIVTGSYNNPNFNELYAPLDGIVGNVVLKFDLL